MVTTMVTVHHSCAAHLLLLLLLLIGSISISGVSGVQFVSLQQGLTSEYALSSADSMLYFKVHQTSEPAGTTMLATFSACTGAINVYGKICDPSKGSCVDDEHVPSRDSHDFQVTTKCTVPWAGQEPLSGTTLCGTMGITSATSSSSTTTTTSSSTTTGSTSTTSTSTSTTSSTTTSTSTTSTTTTSSCPTTVIYYYALGAADGVSFAQSAPLLVNAYMRTYRTSDRTPVPLRISTDRALQFDVYSGHLQWKPVEQCEKWDEQRSVCETRERVAGARYRVFYVETRANESDTVRADTPNVGTVCGAMHAVRSGGAYGASNGGTTTGTTTGDTTASATGDSTAGSSGWIIPVLENNPHLEYVLPFFAVQRDYTYRVNVMSESSDYPGEASVAYRPAIVSRTHDGLESRVLKIIFVMLFTGIGALLLFLALLGTVYAVFHFTRRKYEGTNEEERGEKVSLLGSPPKGSSQTVEQQQKQQQPTAQADRVSQ